MNMTMAINSATKTTPLKLIRSTCIGIVCTVGLSGSPLLNADNLRIPLGQQGSNIDKPRTGISKDRVESRYGSPVRQRGPVGDPPIYTWEYNSFIVYFEGDNVIHSVAKAR